mmetsp:Transcript_33817/g.97504  ORF Transcript_33817/g.97504 Transcript_33817/m.97504 type:complete len:81 (-) Transcript_33817:96-338(-)
MQVALATSRVWPVCSVLAAAADKDEGANTQIRWPQTHTQTRLPACLPACLESESNSDYVLRIEKRSPWRAREAARLKAMR